ncbi:transcription-repair coupling factor [Gammaproteobacteria bacterium 45_16_T64]|nr:transcription-repair coupling factor [Gammaproteobacteria bacterium 45_16_T64]
MGHKKIQLSAQLQQHLPSKLGDTRIWGNLADSGTSLGIAEASSHHDGLTLVIAPDTFTALQIEQDLRFFCSDDHEILSFPDWETLPYDSFSPHQDIISQRLATLYRLPKVTKGTLVVPLSTGMHRVSPHHFLAGRSLVLNTGQQFDIEITRIQLEESGYHCVDSVYEHGEFAVRGAIVDIFPMGSDVPYRIELFDDEIDTLRTFNPETQRSLEKMESVSLLPAKEFPLDPDSIAQFKVRWKKTFDVNHRACPMYQDVNDGIASAGIEYYLPLFFEQTATLFDYLPSNTLIITPENLDTNITQFWNDCHIRYEELRHDTLKPILAPKDLFLPVDFFFAQLKGFRRIGLQSSPTEDKSGRFSLPLQAPESLYVDAKAQQPLAKLEAFLIAAKNEGRRVLFCAESPGRKETLLELLGRIRIHPKPVDSWSQFLADSDEHNVIIGPLAAGLIVNDTHPIAIITEDQLFGQRVIQQRRRKKTDDQADNIIKNLTELKLNAPVVHLDHGVGRYKGLQSLDIDGQAQEFLTLEYAKDAKLYVPVSSLHLISRYSGADENHAPLHKLGTEQWSREKRKAAEQVHDVAAELLNIYARRAAKKGHAFSLNKLDYEIFKEGFPFEETPDQQTAINSVVNDMLSIQPMDRLVCGDVGFGKTEVAMRAAFIASQGGKQVAVLVPTTLLAQQHYESFKDRFADWPLHIEVLSRFKSGKEQTAALKSIAEGKVDIVVGTHKLLQEGLKFKELGLVIVDEEHRFGVRHKERLKSLRADVDMLTLTATPIPRTLNMAMSGIRDLSIIATPPAKRLSIKTFIRQDDPAVSKEAILRELLRGGQVYLLHNEVKSIDKRAKEIEELIPEARVIVAHGQMRERELEHVMSEFYHKRYNVLVCTTIIETGIDVPSANTIIMDRADKLGLAQLHQLRGRVGRSHHQAYAYLMTPHPKSMTGDAKKRLEAIGNAQDLGAGFTLASHDMEIRGAGELLGDEQSGNMHSIGFSLYMEMLEQAIEAIKEGKTPNLDKPLQHGAEINLRLPALITDDYLADVHTRLIMYKRIANAKTNNDLDELRVELIDRFGTLPGATRNLFSVTKLKLLAQQVGIAKIDAGPNGGKLEFGASTQVDPLTIVKLVQSQPQFYRLEGADKLRFTLELENYDERIEAVNTLINTLLPKNKKSA